jgi:hypothetical protein
MDLNCFKAYDIRGRAPDEMNEGLAGRIVKPRHAENLPAPKNRPMPVVMNDMASRRFPS